ncbi:hypothetical protein D5086_003061 [Populus alba]|uniref:Uncharacterized protein n=1 Tax=Populus alba TaxID=43335 RepID=A0ACC4D3E7_POPAL
MSLNNSRERHLLLRRMKFCAFIVIFAALGAIAFAEDDARCLQGVQNSLGDPEGRLAKWNFANSSVGFICNFVGVSCWNDRENRIINLELRDMNLSGQVPESLQYCKSLQKLDLSSNSLSGTIPAQICTLKSFSVANNDLTGPVPSFFNNYDSANFDGNKGLCGRPLSKCGGLSKKNLAIIIAAGVFGAASSLLLGFGVWWWYRSKQSGRRKGGYDVGRGDDTNWAQRLRIGLGAARGLAWLHHGYQPPFLHQNICSNAILVDEDFDARIMDFGLARMMTSSDSIESSYVNGDLGEIGYVAPEYSSTMVASLKGDVYGFGVVLLELVTGQKPLDISTAEGGFKGNLVDWVNHLSSSGRSKDAVEKAICGKGHDEEISQFLKIACKCVIARPKDRWSMHEAYHSLKNIANERGLSEQDDEFPLIFGKQGHD